MLNTRVTAVHKCRHGEMGALEVHFVVVLPECVLVFTEVTILSVWISARVWGGRYIRYVSGDMTLACPSFC